MLGGFEVANDEGVEKTYKQFVEEATKDHFDVDTAENKYWTEITTQTREYSSNNNFSCFGDETVIWNLNKFTSDHSCIHTKPSHEFLKVSVDLYINAASCHTFFFPFQRNRSIYAMPGIQTPYVYIRKALTSFQWHIEDGNIGGVNYLHSGSPTIW